MLLYEFRMNQDYGKDNLWHMVAWHEHGLFSTCGHSRARFDEVQDVVQLDRLATISAAEAKALPAPLGRIENRSKGRVCAHCAQIITQTKLNPDSREMRGAIVIPEQKMVPEQSIESIDPTKPIIVCNGAIHQADEKTLTAAKSLAKQIIGNAATAAVIYVPHTKVERPVPPLKATRIKFT